MACSKLGAVALYLNTAFAGPQLADVIERERPAALIYDDEFTDLLSGVGSSLRRYVAWEEEGAERTDEAATVEKLISSAHGDDLEPPDENGRFIILTSGTTGTPKGAQRGQPEGLGALAALFSKIPRRRRETVMIAAPLFHSWGFLALHPQPAARRDDGPAAPLRPRGHPASDRRAPRPHPRRGPGDDAADPRAPAEVRRRYDLSHLEVTAASGSALPGRARHEVDGRVRRQPLQPLRLDRGLLGDDRHPRGHARGARHRRKAAAGDRDPDRRRARATTFPRARPAVSSSATRWPSRATREAATRSTSASCSPPATSATSTRRAACSSTAATTR